MSAPPIRWGILGCGAIAQTFADSVNHGTRSTIWAVGSRERHRAEHFATTCGAARSFGFYAELVEDDHVDAVYVATPHSRHHADALLALAAGKPVLVEKAFTRNAQEAREVVAFARGHRLFAMEAMWTRFLPHIDVVRQVLESGLLGDIRTVIADHGQLLFPNGPPRLAQLELAGGALLDLGVYPVSFAHLVMGEFTTVAGCGDLTADGVDCQESITIRGRHGELGLLSTTMLAQTPTTASISGTRARLELGNWFFAPTTVRLIASSGRVVDEYTPARPPHRLLDEAAEVARCLEAGLLESGLMPLDETVAILEALDEIRGQLGVRFPREPARHVN